MQYLGHKKINDTLKYPQLVSFKTDEYTSKVPKSIEDDVELIEAGFECVTDRDGSRLFRKRK